jgi:O-acetyl-ADP-ribose deacetylase (regulator of RNase III)
MKKFYFDIVHAAKCAREGWGGGVSVSISATGYGLDGPEIESG